MLNISNKAPKDKIIDYIRFKYKNFKRIKLCKTALASFPRSGNTLTRYMLSNYLNRIDKTNLNEEELLNTYTPSLISKKSIDPKKAVIIKTHHEFNKNYKKAIFLYRHPIDSYFSFVVAEAQGGNCDRYPNLLKIIKKYPIEKFCQSFIEINLTWLKIIEIKKIPIIHFEYQEIIKKREQFFKKVIEFLDLKYEDIYLKETIEYFKNKNVSYKYESQSEARNSLSKIKEYYLNYSDKFKDINKAVNFYEIMIKKLK